MRLMTVIAILVAAVLAGCSEPVTQSSDPDDGSTTTTPPPGTGGTDAGDDTSTGDPSDGNGSVNRPPSLQVTADNATGAVPFDVVFTINGTDPDADALNWTVRLAGDEVGSGDTVPANLAVTITEAGNHTFRFFLGDGNHTVAGNYTIVAGVDAPVGPVQVELITRTWKTGAGTNTAPATYLLCSGPEDGHTIATFPMDPAHMARTFKATVTDASGGVAVESWRIVFNSPGCGVDTHAVGSGDGGGAADLEGTIPDGYDFGFFTSYGGANLSATLEIYA